MAKKGSLRIIGGDWRGRRLEIADLPGLRPTPDRVRETLFNWLQWDIAGSRCLDLFGGTGALGFEAASRGAAQVVVVERESTAARRIQGNVDLLGAGALISVIATDALQYLKENQRDAFDLIFLDPPYHTGLLGQAIDLLRASALCGEGTRIYMEFAADEAEPELPAIWREGKRKQAGQVVYGLYECCGAV